MIIIIGFIFTILISRRQYGDFLFKLIINNINYDDVIYM